MRIDRTKERLTTPNHALTRTEAVCKLVDLINLYHSIDLRHGSSDDKEEAKRLIIQKIKSLKGKVGTSLSTNSMWYVANQDAWECARESFLP